MDIAVKKKGTSLKLAYGLIALLIALILAGMAMSTSTVQSEDLIVYEVKNGDLSASLSGYGKIKALKSKWTITRAGGFVEQIHKKAGAFVNKGDLILTLSNQMLLDKILEAKQNILELKAETQSLKARINGQRLSEQKDINRLKSEFNSVNIELLAHKKLLNQGVVSKIEFDKTQLLVKELKERLKYEQEISKQNNQIKAAEIKAQEIKLQILNNKLTQLQQQQAELNVVAGETGLLSQLSPEVVLGKKVAQDTALIEIIDTNTFYAEIKIPVQASNELAIGQLTDLTINKKSYTGKVERISPQVAGGYLMLDVAMDMAQEPSFAVGTPVTVTINTGQLSNVTYIDNVTSFDLQHVYFASKDSAAEFKLKEVKFGDRYSGALLINSQLSAGDKLAFVTNKSKTFPKEFILNKEES